MNARLIFYILFLLTISTGTVMIMTLPKGNLALPLILTSVTLVTEWVLLSNFCIDKGLGGAPPAAPPHHPPPPPGFSYY